MKKSLGNILYPLIRRVILKLNPEQEKEYTPKVTGMLIDFDVLQIEEILDLIKTEDLLAARVDEALNLIYEDEKSQN